MQRTYCESVVIDFVSYIKAVFFKMAFLFLIISNYFVFLCSVTSFADT